MKVTGKVVWRDLEGGFFELHADGGTRYRLAGARVKDGERVSLEGEVEEGGFGIDMSGLPTFRARSVSR